MEYGGEGGLGVYDLREERGLRIETGSPLGRSWKGESENLEV